MAPGVWQAVDQPKAKRWICLQKLIWRWRQGGSYIKLVFDEHDQIDGHGVVLSPTGVIGLEKR